MLLDYVSNLVPTFVGEGYAAEVVVTGKGSLLGRECRSEQG